MPWQHGDVTKALYFGCSCGRCHPRFTPKAAAFGLKQHLANVCLWPKAWAEKRKGKRKGDRKGPKRGQTYFFLNKSVPNGTYLTFFGCPFLLTSALAAERVCISIG